MKTNGFSLPDLDLTTKKVEKTLGVEDMQLKPEEIAMILKSREQRVKSKKKANFDNLFTEPRNNPMRTGEWG